MILAIEEFGCFAIDLGSWKFYDFDFDLKKEKFSMILLLTYERRSFVNWLLIRMLSTFIDFDTDL